MPDLSWANRQVSRVCPHQALNELLEDDEKFGFIVMDGLGCYCDAAFLTSLRCMLVVVMSVADRFPLGAVATQSEFYGLFLSECVFPGRSSQEARPWWSIFSPICAHSC